MSLTRVLLVDDNDAVRTTMAKILELNNFEVVAASGVKEALSRIGNESFDVLLTDLHMPGAGDGMTVVSAMRHSNPHSVTLVFSGYPEMQAALSAILVQADEVLLKPLDIPALVSMIRDKLVSRKSEAPIPPRSVADILERGSDLTIQHWLERVERTPELTAVSLNFKDRTGHLPQLLKDLVNRLREPHCLEGKSKPSRAATFHGRLRSEQGYSAAMMIEESRMLQVSIFETLRSNLASVDFSLLLADVMTIADEVDSQLAQAMRSYMNNTSHQKRISA